MTINRRIKGLVRQVCPPVLWTAARLLRDAVKAGRPARTPDGSGNAQDLDVYWDPEMAAILETWGEGNVWNEIQLLMHPHAGKALDIACGTGKTMQMLAPYAALELHGCDISDLLIGKAIERGIPRDRLRIIDATRMEYADREFEFAYSIGSLEHFTEDGMVEAIRESARVVRRTSFHMVPVSRSGRDEGWMKTQQSFFNNSVPWWLQKYRAAYPHVVVLDSAWNDTISVGKWFACYKDAPA